MYKLGDLGQGQGISVCLLRKWGKTASSDQRTVLEDLIVKVFHGDMEVEMKCEDRIREIG
jgi:hypothetical protein